MSEVLVWELCIELTMNADIHIYFSFMDRYHQLIANYRKDKNIKKISEDKTLGTTLNTEELKEGKKIKTE